MKKTIAGTLAARVRVGSRPAVAAAAGSLTSAGGSSLESAASQASSTGRTIAFSLIGLALAVAAVVLVFKRDFKEAVGVLAIGDHRRAAREPGGADACSRTRSRCCSGRTDGGLAARGPLVPVGVRARAAHLPDRHAAPEPGGVPLRGIVYAVALVAAALVAGGGAADRAGSTR